MVLSVVLGRITQHNANQLLEETRQVTDGSLPVFFSDQRPHYKEAILKAFGEQVIPPRKGNRGRFPLPRWVPPEDLLYAQLVKHRKNGRVVQVTHRVVFGCEEALWQHLEHSPVSTTLNTAFVERENGTIRQHNPRCARKCLTFSKTPEMMAYHTHLCLAYTHFCLPHGGLRESLPEPIPTKGDGSPKKWRPVTPMMACGVTDHIWDIKELLTFHVPPHKKQNTTNKGH